MVEYQVYFTKRALKDRSKIKEVGLEKKARNLLDILKTKAYQNPPKYEKLVGNVEGAYSRRINRQHRLIYQVHEKEKKIKVIQMWTHYE